ncbi:MAG TPA: P-II family nitrogen regulator [Treponemataceae bacterium]|nr:P-II family nitrogen regulator [Treponemataceae bacterium]
MKKLEIIIRPERLEIVKHILNDAGASGMMVTNIMGFGNQKGVTHIYRGTEYTVNLLPKLKVETVVADEKKQMIVDELCKQIASGNPGDGKIFVYDVEDVVRIRTGENGNVAL